MFSLQFLGLLGSSGPSVVMRKGAKAFIGAKAIVQSRLELREGAIMLIAKRSDATEIEILLHSRRVA